MMLLLAAPAGGEVRRDTVIRAQSVGSAQISATAEASRYAVNDGSGTTVAIAVTAACQVSCNAADAQQVADFLGTLAHGEEMELLTVQLDTPSQIEFDCGYGAQACYYGGENKIFLNGDDASAPDGASREFVLAHEYGHHIARHRESPPPFPVALDWGTARWSSYENVCRRSRAGALFPGNEGLHYFRDPGEAFAESYAHMRFPEAEVPWRWVRSLEPDAGAFEAIREDVLHPWPGRTVFKLHGRVPPRQGAPRCAPSRHRSMAWSACAPPAGAATASACATRPAASCAAPATASASATGSTSPSAASPSCASPCTPPTAAAPPSSCKSSDPEIMPPG